MAQETWKPENPQVEAQPSLKVEEVKKDNQKEWKPTTKSLDDAMSQQSERIKYYRSMGYDPATAQQKANVDVNFGGDYNKNYEVGSKHFDKLVKDADEISKYDKSKYLVKEISTQNPSPDNYSYWDDDRIKGAFNFGNGTWKDMVNHINNNKGLAKYEIIRGDNRFISPKEHIDRKELYDLGFDDKILENAEKVDLLKRNYEALGRQKEVDALTKWQEKLNKNFDFAPNETWQDENGNRFYKLTDDFMNRVYKRVGGDENKLLDQLRKYDFGMSNGDLQGVVDLYMENKTGLPIWERMKR